MYCSQPTVYEQPKCNPVENTVQFSSVVLCLEHFFMSIIHMEKITSPVAICKQTWIPISVKAVKHSVPYYIVCFFMAEVQNKVYTLPYITCSPVYNKELPYHAIVQQNTKQHTNYNVVLHDWIMLLL